MGYTPSTSGPSAERDQNGVTTLMGVSSVDGVTPVPLYANPSTGRLLVSATGGGSGIASINTDTTSVQTLTTGTTGTDFAIVDNGSGDHKFNIPDASATARGLVTTGTQTIAGAKTFSTAPVLSSLTASQILATDASKNIQSLAVATYPSLTELSYVKGVTSAIQTQINAKGVGTVTAVSVATANGFSGTVTNSTTTPAITIIAGAITPTSVNGVTLSGSSTPTLAVTGTTTVSGSNTGDQTISDATISITDITTNDSSTSKHGFLSKLDNNAGHYMDGTGNWTAPTGSGVTPLTTGFSISAGTTPKTLTNQVNTTFTGGDMTFTGSGTNTYTFPSTTDTLAGLGTAQTFTATQTQKCIIDTNNAITASGNAASVPITYRLNTVTNNSAATLTITMNITSAASGQLAIVRILDFSGVTQTIAWVNTEDSTVAAPTTSNGSTTLPLTVGFQYNSATSKWRCIAKA